MIKTLTLVLGLMLLGTAAAQAMTDCCGAAPCCDDAMPCCE